MQNKVEKENIEMVSEADVVVTTDGSDLTSVNVKREKKKKSNRAVDGAATTNSDIKSKVMNAEMISEAAVVTDVSGVVKKKSKRKLEETISGTNDVSEAAPDDASADKKKPKRVRTRSETSLLEAVAAATQVNSVEGEGGKEGVNKKKKKKPETGQDPSDSPPTKKKKTSATSLKSEKGGASIDVTTELANGKAVKLTNGKGAADVSGIVNDEGGKTIDAESAGSFSKFRISPGLVSRLEGTYRLLATDRN